MTTAPLPSSSAPADGADRRIVHRYLLLQGSTPVHVDREGRRWLEKLWAIDARAHLVHIRDFRIACPVVAIDRASDQMTSVDDDPLLARIVFVPLPDARSRPQALLQLPRMLARLWSAIGQADIVHMGIAGWPYPLGWLGLPMAKMRGRKTFVVVESAPWRTTGMQSPSRSQRLLAGVYEALGGMVVRACDLKFFTTQSYRQSLSGGASANAHVVEATWIPATQIVAEPALEEALRADTDVTRPIRLAFFGRIAREKGVLFLLEAMRRAPADLCVDLDIYGEGPELDALRDALWAEPALAARIALRGTLAYGKALFDRLRAYDYLAVPSLSDEQPRIVYDAYSQGVPVIASSTDGLRQCVRDQETGLLFEPGAVAPFLEVLRGVATPEGRERRARLARAGVRVARGMTHDAMHERRRDLVAEFLARA